MKPKHFLVFDQEGEYLIVAQEIAGDPYVVARGLPYVIASAAVKGLNE